jgi:hypothetical protein
MYVVAARFSEQTWLEHTAFRERKKLVGCIYGSPLPMANSIPFRAPVFVLEMNFKQHRIMGVGLIRNDCIVDVHRIYSDTQYNVCAYEGKYRVTREEMDREEDELLDTLEQMLFWQCKIWRTRNGLTQIPKWVRETEGLDYENILRNMFISRFLPKITQPSDDKPDDELDAPQEKANLHSDGK